MRDTLHVFYEERLVGNLWKNELGYIGFQYAKKWIENGFPISQQLPITSEIYQPEKKVAHQFFANLLPEANARIHVVRDLKISDSDFELLKAIGGECAGALSILPITVKSDQSAAYISLTDSDLKKIILRKGNITSFYSEKNHPRLSLAGAQDKCPIFYDKKNYFLPNNASPSTHILKFDVMGYRHIPAYEYFLTQLAHSIRLPVVHSHLEKMDQDYFLLIERYDRIVEKNKTIKRLHQEDFCQALGVSHLKKYQQEGGPSFLDCYNLIKKVSINPIVDAENLLKWQMFNVLAGNSDGHAKNIALLYDENERVTLAPFYDLVCTRAIERVDSRLALSVGDEFNPDRVTLKKWEQLAISCHINPSYLKKLLFQIATLLLKNLQATKISFEKEYGPYPALQRVEKVITKNCKKLINV